MQLPSLRTSVANSSFDDYCQDYIFRGNTLLANFPDTYSVLNSNFSTSSKLNLLDIFHPTVENSKIIQNHTNRFHKKRRYRRSQEVHAHVHPRTMCCILQQKTPKLSVVICLPSVVFLSQNPKSVLFSPTVEN